MLKVFLKDIFDKKIVFRYMIFSFILFFISNIFFRNYKSLKNISTKSMEIYIMVGLLFSTFFFVRTYIKNDRILLYYSLPVNKSKINESFITCILIDIFLRKISILMAVLLNLSIKPIFFVKLFLMIPVIVILSCVVNVTNVSKSNKVIVASISIVYICTVFIISYNKKLVTTIILGLVICFFYCLFIRNYFIKFAFFKIDILNNLSKINLDNYFLKFFFAENVYLINTIGIIVFIIFLGLFSPKEMSIPLSCAVGTINTPLLTIFSTEKDLENMTNLLPNKFRSLNRDYIYLITMYFSIIQIIILSINFSNISINMVIQFLIIIIIEVYFSYILEKKYPIKNKKTIIEIWKNPRKYFLTIIIFLISVLFQSL